MTVSNVCMLLFTFLITLSIINAVPILPIIKAIAGSASSMMNVDVDVLGIAKWMKESTKISNSPLINFLKIFCLQCYFQVTWVI